MLAAAVTAATVLAVIGANDHGFSGLSRTLAKPHATVPSAPGHASATPTPTSGPSLASTPYAAYAFQVYPGDLSSTTKQALSGFDVSVKRAGSTIRVTVALIGSPQPGVDQTYPAEDHVYFVETSLGDDSGNGEFNLGDDGIVITDAQGRIVQ